MSENLSNISTWYSGKSVFMTGATGFIGKVLLEKLLRSCPDLKNIYILVRNKKGLKAEERKHHLINCPLFDLVRKTNADLFNKIIIIQGDIIEPNLGICLEDRVVLTQNVSIIFHSAATVKFNEKLKSAIEMNVLGTLEIINLALEMKNLQAFIHISTAFSNCNLKEIDEKLYEAPIDLNDLLQITKLLDEDLINYLTPKLLKDWPNTYTYTKALAEQLVALQSTRLPVAIVRPSIVSAAWQEPIPGWVENVSGLTGLIVSYSKGIQRTFLACSHQTCDMVPVDITVNLTIAVAWHVATNKFNSIPIFNCSTGVLNPVYCYDLKTNLRKSIHEYPLNFMVWYPAGIFTTNRFVHKLSCFLFRQLPAYFFDCILSIYGKKPFLVKISDKVDTFINVNSYFTLREWKFHSKNVPKLLEKLSIADKTEYNFDVQTINYNEYFKNYVLGVKQFILKENLADLPKARQTLKRLKITHFTILSLLTIFLFTVFFDLFAGTNILI